MPFTHDSLTSVTVPVDVADDPELTAEVAYAAELRHWRERRGMSQQALADRLAYDRSYVSHIEGGSHLPTEGFTQRAEEVLDTGGALWARWDSLRLDNVNDGDGRARRSDRDLQTVEFVSWISDHSDRSFSDVYQDVAVLADRHEQESASARHTRSHAQASISRASLADAMIDYYGPPRDEFDVFRVNVGEEELRLSLLTRPTWFESSVPLGTSAERMALHLDAPDSTAELSGPTYQGAISRLARAEIDPRVMVNSPIYRMTSVQLDSSTLSASFALSDFASFALTSDLMESELVNALSGGTGSPPTLDLPLRAAYLPTIDNTLNPAVRECAGGPAALLAIARPANGRRPADYVLLIQERSGQVVNAAGKLAVIPKAFHQPAIEPAREVDLSATLIREFEEELLGRQDLEHLSPKSWRRADTLHRHHRSEPVAWLLDRAGDAFRTECTGFGYNLINGTFEFPCLIVIDDESWWTQWGHMVEANWEALRVHRYSSLDSDGLAALVHDPRWSNEGLFAYLQGLRRLTELDSGSRVAAPPIQIEGNGQ